MTTNVVTTLIQSDQCCDCELICYDAGIPFVQDTVSVLDLGNGTFGAALPVSQGTLCLNNANYYT